MKPKLILCLALVLSGGLFGFSHRPIPTVESAQGFSSSKSNEWLGLSFADIMPPQQVKQIVLIYADLHNPFSSKLPPQDIRNYYNQLFNRMELSSQKAGDAYEADNEGTRAQFAVVTSLGIVIHIEDLGTAMLISGHGIKVRINFTDFRRTTATNQPAPDARQLLPSVETDYLLDQNPGDWEGQRFEQIVPLNKIKRIVLLEEFADILDYFPKESNVSAQSEHQNGYDKLFNQFEVSNETAKSVFLDKYETPLGRLLLLTDSDEVIYLEIIGHSGRIENGSVVGNHIAAVLIHGYRKGVRINLNFIPVSLGR